MQFSRDAYRSHFDGQDVYDPPGRNSGGQASSYRRDQDRIDEIEQLQRQVRAMQVQGVGPSRSPPRLNADDYIDVAGTPHAEQKPPRATSSPRHGHPYWIEEDAAPVTFSAPRPTQIAVRHAESSLHLLKSTLPYLSPEFTCSNDDAELLLTYVTSSARPVLGSSSSTLEDKVIELECEVKQLTQRLQKRTEEVDRMKDEVAEAKQKMRATETQAKQTANVLSQRREETRKQLLVEESRNSKLQFQNKGLQQEVDKLKERVHQLLSR
jgi:hypothetical protein